MSNAGLGQALLHLAELDVYDAAAGTLFHRHGVILLLCRSSITLLLRLPLPQSTKLNSLQISLLCLFECGISDDEVLELRQVLVGHMSQKLLAEVERVNEERGYTAADVQAMLNDPS